MNTAMWRTESVNQLRKRRTDLIEQARTMVNDAEAEGRELSQGQRDVWIKTNAEIDRLALQIREQLDGERADAVRMSGDVGIGVDAAQVIDFCRRAGRETMELTFGPEADRQLREHRSDFLAGAGTGVNVVPVSFVRQLREHLIENSAIRQAGATVIVTTSGEDLRVPKTTDHGGAALVGEGTTIPTAAPVFGQVTLEAYKYGNLLQLSTEFVQDEAVNVIEYLARATGRAIGNAAGAHFITGDGSDKPRGVAEAAAQGKEAATAALTGDDLIDLAHSVTPGYRANATWMMNDSTLAYIRKLKSNDDQYLWTPGLRENEPGRLLGRPVVIDPNLDDIGAENRSVLFGDFSGYYIRDVGTVRFERSDEFAFDEDLVTFRALMRTDGDLVDENAVKALDHADAG